VTGRELVHALRELKPRIGDLLRIKRLKDGPGPIAMRFSVERLDQPEDGHDEAA
jgi:hypothetical protein